MVSGKSHIRSLRSRIFVFMIALVVVAFFLIALVTIYQYNEQAIDYHEERLERKESQLLASIDYSLDQAEIPATSQNIAKIFDQKLFEIADIQNIAVSLYSLDGHLLLCTDACENEEGHLKDIPQDVINGLKQSSENRIVTMEDGDDSVTRSSYLLLKNEQSELIGILYVPYFDDDSLNDAELREFLIRLGLAYLILLFVAITFAFFVSRFITRSLMNITQKMKETRLEKRNLKIDPIGAGQELFELVESYNNMIDELEESAVKLAASEREQAWREMAKQVAHEIKNPLTPMRLNLQSFAATFKRENPLADQQLKDFCQSMLEQIDTLNAIASAFSSFADLPEPKKEQLNVGEVVKSAIELFAEIKISLKIPDQQVYANFDRTQLIRIMTNLIKNAIQSVPKGKSPIIVVTVTETESMVQIGVKDNGLGIAVENQKKIFEPKFTTKSSGMGLGLPIVKTILDSYGGRIFFESIPSFSTTFYIEFSKN